MERIRVIGLAILLPCRRMAQLLRLGLLGTMVVEVTPGTFVFMSTPAEGGSNAVVTWTGPFEKVCSVGLFRCRPMAPFSLSVPKCLPLSTALVMAKSMYFNGYRMHGNHWDLRLTHQDQALSVSSVPPSLSPTAAPSWPWETFSIRLTLQAASKCLHGPARIGPNGGTTFSVPKTMASGRRFRCHPTDPSLLVVPI